MRLLNTETGEFFWVEKPTDVAYAILSHVWDTAGAGEPTYQEVLRLQPIPRAGDPPEPLFPDKPIFYKIRQGCRIAREQGYQYLWIDTCCIDKTSSTELSEAINSMWEWYRLASVCYAYLADVHPRDDALGLPSDFRGSKWHTRGWTLQELIAPMYVLFLASDWSMFGTKASLAGVLEEVTGVDRAVLTHEKPLHDVSVARRMWWASKRRTTRLEDAAYSLMGIFGINMSTIYGEGPRSFLRLQEEILRTIPDQSIFAWHHHHGYNYGDCMFAWSPSYFSRSSTIRPIAHKDFVTRLGLDANTGFPTYAITSYGISTRLPLIPHDITSPNPTTALYEVFGRVARFAYLLVLECVDESGDLIVLTLNRPRDAQSHNEYVISAVETMSGRSDRMWHHSLSLYYKAIRMQEIVVLHRPRQSLVSPVMVPTFPTPSASLPTEPGEGAAAPAKLLSKVVLHHWCQSLLGKYHYDVSYTVVERAESSAPPPTPESARARDPPPLPRLPRRGPQRDDAEVQPPREQEAALDSPPLPRPALRVPLCKEGSLPPRPESASDSPQPPPLRPRRGVPRNDEVHSFVLRSTHPRACPRILISIVATPRRPAPLSATHLSVRYEDSALPSTEEDGLHLAVPIGTASEDDSVVLWRRYLVRTSEGVSQILGVCVSRPAGVYTLYHLSIEPDTPGDTIQGDWTDRSMISITVPADAGTMSNGSRGGKVRQFFVPGIRRITQLYKKP